MIDSDQSSLPFVMIGGGISGLALTYWLRQQGVDARLMEKGESAGGVMQTIERDGFIFERGPNTILDKLPVVDELIDQLGLSGNVDRTELKTQDRYIWREKKLWTVPHGPGDFIKGHLFSTTAKLRLAREFMISPVREDETLKDFVIRRFGEQPYERAFLPMVQGLWAGDPAKMSTALSFPMLKELEHESGGVIKGMMHRQKESDGTQRRTTSMVGFDKGLRMLRDGMTNALGDALSLGTEVTGVTTRERRGYTLTLRENGTERSIHADQIGLSGDARIVGSLLEGIDPELAKAFASIHYCPLLVASLGIPKSSATIPEGFGFLAQRDQGLRLLGVIFNSNFMPGNAPAGQAALTVMLGGDLDPGILDLDDAAILQMIREDLRKAIGWNGVLTAHELTRWPRAIPQYHMHHHAVLKQIDAAEQQHPGLHLFGNWRDGTAIPERIELAKKLADQIAQHAKTSE